MYKVLIADDEHKICRLINKLIDWQGIGLESVGIANDGEAAYRLIRETRPDIVITDIKMPRLSGIDLIKRVREEDDKCKFIVLSGHKQFDYARDAFKYKAVDYLLKPVNKEELNSTLQKICNMIAAEQDESNRLIRLEDRLEDNRRKLSELFLANCELGTIPASWKACNDEFGLNLGEGSYTAFYLAVDNGTFSLDQNKHINITDKISEIFKETFSVHCDEFVSAPMNNSVLAISFYRPERNQNIKKLIHSAFSHISHYTAGFSGLAVTMGVGIEQEDYSRLTYAVKTACHAAKCRILLGRNRCIFFSDLSYRYTNAETLLQKPARHQLARLFEILDTEGYVQWLDTLISSFDANYLPSILFDIGEEICEVFDEMVETVLPGVAFEDGPLKPEMLLRISASSSLWEVKNAVCAPVVSRLKFLLEQKSILDYAPIRESKQYIADHYMDQVKLEDIARKVYMHPAYLSTIFKKSTGMNFTDYLTEFRIKRAKELLSTTNDRINDIAKKVGYIEPHSFSKRFTALVGIKPTDYRKLHS